MKKSVYISLISLILLFGISICLSSYIATANPDQSTSINLGSYTTYAGSNVTVPIEILNASAVAGGSVNISFNALFVNVEEVLPGDFGMPVANINNTAGFVSIAKSTATAVGKANASLASVRFKGIAKGVTTLNITDAYLNYENGSLFFPETSDGTINVCTPPLLFIASYDVYADSNVTIPVEITNATDIAGGSVKIVFNASIVHAQSVTPGHFGTNITASIDNTSGSVHVAVANTTAVGIEEAVLANITFKGLSGGFTALELQNASLNDEQGNVIIPETSDGTINVVEKLHNVSIESVPMEQSVEPDENATFTLTVTNPGNVADTIELSITLKEADSATLSEDTFVLNAGASATAYLNVSDSAVGTYNTTVRATSQGNTGVFDEVTVKTNVTAAPAAAPNITSFAPPSPVSDTEGATRTFNITINQIVSVSWQMNGTEVQTNTNVTEASYTNTSAVIGTWNVSAIVNNTNGTDIQTWIWTVEAPSPCFIATAAYGTPVHEDINILRKFRNEVLSTNTPGKAIVETYYSTSPPIANALAANNGLRASVRVLLLTPLVYFAGITLNGGLFALIILTAFLAGLLYLYRTRKYGVGISKSLGLGILSIAVLTSLVFTLGWLGYTWSVCATIAAYILPLIIPIAIGVVVIAVIRSKYKNKFTLSSGGE